MATTTPRPTPFEARWRAAIALVCVAIALPACADSGAKPFELRLFQALDRQSNYASTLGRQASMAFADGASINPAAGVAREGDAPATSIAATYVQGDDPGGHRTFAVPVTLRWRLPQQRSLFVAYAPTRTPDTTSRDGLARALRSDEYIAGYAQRITDDASAGISARVTDGSIARELAADPLATTTLRSDTHFFGVDVSAGLIATLGARTTAGVAATVGRTRASSTVRNVDAFALPLPTGIVIVAPESVLDRFGDRIRNVAVRAGVGYRFTDDVGVYADAHFSRDESERVGSVDVARAAIGFEHAITAAWSWRAGVGVDSNGAVDLSAGVGVRLAPNVDLQLAWQNNAAPEINAELGRTRLLAATLGVRLP